MQNKKKTGTVAAVLLIIALVGGTLAWLVSTDSVKNMFTTKNIGGDPSKGVEIWEDFNPEKAKNLLPGSTVTKLAQAQNTATYDSFIRVKVTPNWLKSDGTLDVDKNTDNIVLNFGTNLGSEDGKWLKGDDGYYYYMGKVAPSKFTNPLLESVLLSKDLGKDFMGLGYEVLVEAEAIQSDNDAHNDAWVSAGTAVTTKLDGYEANDAGGNNAKANANVTETTTNERK